MYVYIVLLFRVQFGEPGYGVVIPSTDETDRFEYANSSSPPGALMRSTLTINTVEKADYKKVYCCVFINSIGNGEKCIAVKGEFDVCR